MLPLMSMSFLQTSGWQWLFLCFIHVRHYLGDQSRLQIYVSLDPSGQVRAPWCKQSSGFSEPSHDNPWEPHCPVWVPHEIWGKVEEAWKRLCQKAETIRTQHKAENKGYPHNCEEKERTPRIQHCKRSRERQGWCHCQENLPQHSLHTRARCLQDRQGGARAIIHRLSSS